MKVAVILNVSSGPPTPDDGTSTPDRIRDLFVSAGCEANVHLAEGESIASVARQAANSGVDAVVAAGGDGTVSGVAGALADTGVALGVLPMGTFNHFAKDAGIPLGLEDAVRTVVEGVVKPVDAAEVNGRLFVNNSSVGFYPIFVKLRDARQELTGQAKWRAMLAVSFRVFRRYPLLYVRLEADETPIRRLTPSVFVGNNAYRMDLFKQGSRGSLDEGCLCVYIANCQRRWCIVRLAFRLLVGRLEQARDFESISAGELWIEHHKRSLHVSVDGEVLRLEPPLHYRIRPGALKVIVPRPDPL